MTPVRAAVRELHPGHRPAVDQSLTSRSVVPMKQNFDGSLGGDEGEHGGGINEDYSDMNVRHIFLVNYRDLDDYGG